MDSSSSNLSTNEAGFASKAHGGWTYVLHDDASLGMVSSNYCRTI